MERGSFGRVVVAGIVSALVLSGCQLKGGGEDLVNGKTLFVQECAACHVLKRAGATGVTGPDLDAAFAQSRRDGLGESTFRGVVEQQILHPNINQQVEPKDNSDKRLPLMPAKLVEGDDARDVAAYVAQAVAKEGDDPGRLAAGRRAARPRAPPKPRTACSTSPSPPPAWPTPFADAKAPAGELRTSRPRIRSRSTHDIAVEGNGVNEKGEVVQGGGIGVLGRPAAWRVHVLLLRARPPRGWHGRQAHRRVARRAVRYGRGSVLACRCRSRRWFGPWSIPRETTPPEAPRRGCAARHRSPATRSAAHPRTGGVRAHASRLPAGGGAPEAILLPRCMLFQRRSFSDFVTVAPVDGFSCTLTVCERRVPSERVPRRDGLTVTVPDFPAATR